MENRIRSLAEEVALLRHEIERRDDETVTG
jgi:hypothetical protein